MLAHGAGVLKHRTCWRQAVRTAINAQSSGDCGRIMIVLLTDGRANVSLAKSNEDPDALAEGAPKPSQVPPCLLLAPLSIDALVVYITCSLSVCFSLFHGCLCQSFGAVYRVP